jgi:hypothetical protein
VRAEEMIVCALDPRCFAFVSSDGRIGPCVNALLPVHGRVARWDAAGCREVDSIVWGKLPDQSLAEAMACEARGRFLASLNARVRAEQVFLAAVGTEWGPEALRILERADEQRSAALERARFPQACGGCHKASGW